MIIKYFLKQISALALMSTSLVFAQTYPALEMGNVTPSPNTVNNLTVALQKDTNNNTATNLVNYTSPSPLTVNFTVNANSFTNAVRFGTNGAAPFYLAMNTVIGNAGNDNTQYTSNGVQTSVDGVLIQNAATENTLAKSAIGTLTATPGILVLEDTNKAMVLPKVASPHLNIVNPAPGMIVYDTFNKQLAVFNGTVWSFWKQ